MTMYRITYEDGTLETVLGYNLISAISMCKGIPERIIKIERL